MSKQVSKEINVLDRFLYMMDEYSVVYLADESPEFRTFIQGLHGKVTNRLDSLKSASS